MPVINSCKFEAGRHANGERWAGYVTVRRMAPEILPWDGPAWFRELCLAVAAQASSPRLRQLAADIAARMDGGATPRDAWLAGYTSEYDDMAERDVNAYWAINEGVRLLNAVAERPGIRPAFEWGCGFYHLAANSGLALPALPADALGEDTFPIVP